MVNGVVTAQYKNMSLHGHVHTTIFKMDNQQGPTVQHMELCSMTCEWEGCLGENGYVYMYGRVPSPETTATLLISYTPIQKNSLKKFIKKKKKQICPFIVHHSIQSFGFSDHFLSYFTLPILPSHLNFSELHLVTLLRNVAQKCIQRS